MPYLDKQQMEQFEKDGFLVVTDFASSETIAKLQVRIREIIDGFDLDELKVFTTENQTAVLDRYFLESSNKISCFFEENAFDAHGNLQMDRHLAINKIGHALHELDPDFRAFSYRQAVLDIALSLGLAKPSIVQSQYIFKQAKIGGLVHPHTDSTFIYTEPLSCLGLWIALEDATIENGCLSAITGSHKVYLLQQQYVINKRGDGTAFRDTDHPRMEWDTDQLVPIEVKKGDLVLLHGNVVHASNPNTSDKSRHAYVLHLVDLEAKWSAENWLQRPAEMPFQSMEKVLSKS